MSKQLAMAIAVAISGVSAEAALPSKELSLQANKPEVLATKQLAAPPQRSKPAAQTNRFLVQLHSPAIANYQGGIAGIAATVRQDDQVKLDLARPNVLQYRNHLDQEHNQFSANLANQVHGAQIERRFNTVFNGVSVSGQQLSMAQLSALPNVKAVYPERMYSIQMDASLDLINAPEAWTAVSGQANAGAGTRVAIIDSGIRPENPMFSDQGFTAPAGALPDDDYCATVDASFCNNKLIVARYYAPSFAIVEGEYLSPLAYHLHGPHVAGTAVGNAVDVTYQGIPLTLSGVAPGAYLMSYKALFTSVDNPTSAGGTNIMLLNALEDAVNDGADVINNSWGGAAGLDPAFSPYTEAFAAAEAAGVVIVTAAGNSGPSGQSIGCPACIESGIAVASTTHGRYFANEVTIGSQSGILAIEGTSGTPLSADLTGPVTASVNLSSANEEGCSPFAEGSFSNSIALISRGSCTFADKASNAQAAGAIGMVVYNDRPGEPIAMAGLETSNIPSVMVSQTDGNTIQIEAAAGNILTVSAAISRLVSPELADNTSGFSSRGPNGDPNFLKPDMAAPGGNILSASSPDWTGTDFAVISGTSMASPHVAGAAAILRAMHPDWSAVEIKTALTSSAESDGLNKEDGSTPADAFDVGAGRLDMARAVVAELTFDKASFVDTSCILGCTFTTTVTNRGNTAGTWSAAANMATASATVSPTILELAAGQSQDVTVQIDPALAETEVWLFGQLTLNGDTNAHLPLAIFHDISSNQSLLTAFGETPVLEFGSEATFHGLLQNGPFDGEIEVNLAAGNGLSMVAGSGQVQVTNGSTFEESVDESQGTVNWTGQLAVEQFDITTLGDQALPSFASSDNQLLCTAGCDEVSFDLDLSPLEFEYGGRTYSQITISDNGFITAGVQNTSGSFNNQFLPDATSPNNVIAPLWADMDLSDNTGQDSGGGTLHAYTVGNDGETTYVVVEWVNAQLWNDPAGRQYNFQVWLGVNSALGELYLNHREMAASPSFATVGIESLSGTSGAMSYFDGQGTTPFSFNTLAPNIAPGGSVDLAFDLSADRVDVVEDDAGQTLEEQSVTLDVLPNDIGSTVFPFTVTAFTGNTELSALELVTVTGSMPTSLEISTPPINGAVVVNDDDTLSYTPNQDFFGNDSFNYRALNESGLELGEGTVTVQVTNINDAPTITAPAPFSVQENANVTLTAVATDVDDDPLTFSWTQLSGPAIPPSDLLTDSDTLVFTAPEVESEQQLVVIVTVTDGLLSADATVSISVINGSDGNSSINEVGSSGGGGGSLGWLTLWLLPLALRRRRCLL